MARPAVPDEEIPLIYNPASGGGRGELRFARAEARLKLKGFNVNPIATTAPGSATAQALELADEGHKYIFVMGGDGTLSEVANGILRAKAPPVLGCIPAGTGNDFLRDHEITEVDAALDRMQFGQVRQIDAGRVAWGHGIDQGVGPLEKEGGVRFFINVFGTGFAASAADLTNRRFKWVGKRAYTVAVLAEMMKLRPYETQLRIDGKDLSGKYTMVTACNSIHTGGAMKIAPMAKSDDGWFDVLALDQVPRRRLLQIFPKIFDGSHVTCPEVTFHRAKNIEISMDPRSPLLGDGEVYGETHVQVNMLEGALRVLL